MLFRTSHIPERYHEGLGYHATPTVEKVTTDVRPGRELQVALSLVQPLGQAAGSSAAWGKKDYALGRWLRELAGY